MSKNIKLSDIKYVYFDMDGTLLTSEKVPSKRTIELLDKLWARGISCSIATGRPYYFARNEMKIVKPHLPVISCNGALVFDPSDQKLISFSSISKKVTPRIYEILIKNDAVFWIYTKEQMFTYKNDETNPTSKWLERIHTINGSYAKEDQAIINEIKNPNDFDISKHDIIKFLIIYSEIPQEKYKKIEEEVNKLEGVYIVRSQNEVFDIMPEGLSKGNGLQVLHDKGLIDLNQTLVFGDAENDISMFKVARWCVAMGNAQQKTKEIALFETDDHDNDGIAKFFDKLFENEK